MATHQLAKGLASLGRHGDSMLMHVSPSEVAGLQALGQMTGHRLHTNPDTGLPEAFDFGDFFSSLLPTLAGIALAPSTGGASLGLTGTAATMAPIVGGMATGALVAGAKGEDVLGGALMGGLGGYGGGNIAKSFTTMGSNAAQKAAEASIKGGYVPGSVEGANTALQSQPMPSFMTSAPTAPTGAENFMSGIKQFASDPLGSGFDAYKQAGGSAMQLGVPVGLATLSGMQPDPYDYEADEARRKAEEDKYRSLTGGLNLSASSGLNLGLPTLAAQGGLMQSYASGGAISGASNYYGTQASSGGNQDLYGSNDNQLGTQQLSQDGYGIGRLNSLASAGSNAKAADEFYAKGGYLDGEGDGMSDSIHATIEGKQPARLADGEFVIPADVVSHLGNGSSKAGAKQLYAMLHKVRKARTGNPKQGREINPDKYIPA